MRVVNEGTVVVADGRDVGYADYGSAGDATAVLWCHGGPGSRLEPAAIGERASTEDGIRIVGIDRPGYGLSTPKPGRTIADWVPDALAVADALGIDDFIMVGVSTGGAYAFACAAIAPSRVRAVVACCALTDMRWPEGKASMTDGGTQEIWADGTTRDRAIEIARELFGDDGSKLANLAQSSDGPGLPPKDIEMFLDPAWGPSFLAGAAAMFAQGVVGYADDRLADGPGWGTFEVSAVGCPVRVIHGELDTLVPVMQAHYTASIVPGAQLRTYAELGHFSIIGEVLPTVIDLIGA